MLLAIFVLSNQFVFSQTKPVAHINFIEGNWPEALKQATAQHKLVFVDAYASWCGPCKMLKTRTFTDPQVIKFFNANFINLSMDMEQGQGPKLATQWGIQAYPTLIVFNAQGKPVMGTMGYMEPADLLKFAQDALKSKH